MTPVPTLTLSNGVRMPAFGLGTWQSTAAEVEAAVSSALESGYRLIDTAAVYANEVEIGKVLQRFIRAGKLRRQDFFVTTKLPCTHNAAEDVEPALQQSLKNLQLDYVDLYLVHQPTCMTPDFSAHVNSVSVTDTWRGMEQVYLKGLTRAIGVSNCSQEQLARILHSAIVMPHNSQVELHLHFQQADHVRFCAAHDIVVTAYAPMGSPGRSKFVLPNGDRMHWPSSADPLRNAVVRQLAAKYGRSAAQVLLRQHLQRGVAVIPKSANAARIAHNLQVFGFRLTRADMGALAAQPQGARLFQFDFMRGHAEDPFRGERAGAAQRTPPAAADESASMRAKL